MHTFEELNQMLSRIIDAPHGAIVLSENLGLKEALKELEELRTRRALDVDAVRDRLFEGVAKEQRKQHQRTRRLIKKLSPAADLFVELVRVRDEAITARDKQIAEAKNWQETLQAELDTAGREISTLRDRLEGAIEGGKALKHQLDQLRELKGTSDRERRAEQWVQEHKEAIRVLRRQLNKLRKKLGMKPLDR